MTGTGHYIKKSGCRGQARGLQVIKGITNTVINVCQQYTAYIETSWGILEIFLIGYESVFKVLLSFLFFFFFLYYIDL